MPKYFVHNGVPVEFPTKSGKAHDSFMAENPHLADSEVDKAAFDAAREEKERDEVRVARAREYPPIGDQLDAIMKWLATETEFTVPAELKSIAMSCMSVKSRHPLP